MLRKVNILGIDITDGTREEILEQVFTTLKDSSQKQFIVTPNPEMIVYARKHPQFKAILNSASLALCDGVGLYWAGKLLGTPLRQRTTGTDLMDDICKESVRQPVSIGLLGGRRGVADKAAECLKRKYPGINIVFVNAGNPDEHTVREVNKEILRYKDTKILSDKAKTSPNILISQYPGIDILFVAFGHPKQEEWISKHLADLPVKLAMGVGGAFDYISGNVPRAPELIRKLGLEWLFRLVRQPWRWKRQVSLIEFITLVIINKLQY